MKFAATWIGLLVFSILAGVTIGSAMPTSSTFGFIIMVVVAGGLGGVIGLIWPRLVKIIFDKADSL